MKKQIQSIAAIAVLAAASSLSTSVFAAEAGKSAVGTPASNRYTQALITKMDVNRDGKVTKAEFMKFVESEFDFLDKDKSGQLDTSEIMNKEYFSRPANMD